MRLLLAIDPHDAAASPATEAATWATRLRGTLDLVYVHQASHRMPSFYNVAVELPAGAQGARDRITALLRDALARLPPEQRGQVHVVSGDPTTEIVRMAAGYDALLVASHGRKGLAWLLLGSTSEQILRRSPVPVIVLRLQREVP